MSSPLKVGDPCPYCGEPIIECSACDGGKADFFIMNSGCMDCQGGYGKTCSVLPQDDYELWRDLYCSRYGCKEWRENY